MNSRTIYYIDENEDYMDTEIQLALTRTLDENFEIYCQTIAANYAMMNIDVLDYPVKRKIYYVENERA